MGFFSKTKVYNNEIKLPATFTLTFQEVFNGAWICPATFSRLYEICTLSDQQNPDNCLYGFSELIPESNGNLIYEYYENLFKRIDQDNWELFKKNLSEKVIGTHKNARISIIDKSGKTNHSPIYPKFQGFDYFNEGHGYIYLKEEKCCEEVKFIQEIQGNQN